MVTDRIFILLWQWSGHWSNIQSNSVTV